LCDLLQYQRASFVRKLRGVDDDAARRSPVGSGTTLLWLATHMAQAEQTWIVTRFAGRSVPEDLLVAPESLAQAVAIYEQTTALTDGIILGAASLDELCLDAEPAVNLRWILAHLLQETARHAGHVDILRELIDGETGR
jgi:uncharacterized damage-inducible protein DinB